MSKKTVKLCMGILAVSLFAGGCSGSSIGEGLESKREEMQVAKKYRLCFDTDKVTLMNAIKAGKIEVEEDENYGDYPELMESCKSKSGLFHIDLFDHAEEYKKKSDGTYMVQIIFKTDKLQTDEGKREALQILEELCKELDIVYEEETLWGYVENIMEEQEDYIEDDYQENAHILVTKQSKDKEVQFRITPRENADKQSEKNEETVTPVNIEIEETEPIPTPEILGDDTVSYKGKKIKIETKEDYWYILDCEMINDKQLAIYLRHSKNLDIFLVYDLEKEKYIVEKLGLDFTWYNDDITTLAYVNDSNVLHGYCEVCNYNDEVIYSADEEIQIIDLKILEKGKLQIQECTKKDCDLGLMENAAYKEINY